MGKNLNETIYKMMKEYENNKIVFITERLMIKGIVPEDPKMYSDWMVTLKDVKIYKLKEACNSEKCDYSPEPLVQLPNFNIASANIVGFAFCNCENKTKEKEETEYD